MIKLGPPLLLVLGYDDRMIGPKMRSMYDTGRKVRTCTLF